VSIKILTTNPKALLQAIKKSISDGHVETWQVDKDGDFTHSPIQWRNKAWLRPSLDVSILVMYIIRPQDRNISKEVYAIYHGRFIEMITAHFDSSFSSASASAMPQHGDLV
jgi:hypothetical protein